MLTHGMPYRSPRKVSPGSAPIVPIWLNRHHLLSKRTVAPDGTPFSNVGSPFILPTTVTGLAGRISSPLLMGVGPKNMQKALPGGQYPKSPSSTTSCPNSSPAATGMPKYISSPQVLADASMGRASQIMPAVAVSFSVALIVTGPAVILTSR